MDWKSITSINSYRTLRCGEKISLDIFWKFAQENGVKKVSVGHRSDATISRLLGNSTKWFNLREHSLGRKVFVPITYSPLFDHYEFLKLRSGRYGNVLAFHPYWYFDPETASKHRVTQKDLDEKFDKLQELANLTGYHFMCFGSEYSWYYPNHTSLLIVCPEHLTEKILKNKGIVKHIMPRREEVK